MMPNTDVKEILKKNGFRFDKRYGQNFLTDETLLKTLVEKTGVGKDDTIIEIGVGAGTLTAALSDAAKRVIGFEIDRRLQPVLAETLKGRDNVEIVFADVMKIPTEEIVEKAGGRFSVVANLPYYITTPVLMKFLEDCAFVDLIAVTVQESELAEALARLAFPPKLVVTDSQAFGAVSKIVPPTVPLTSFSILMARYKGTLSSAVEAVRVLDTLKDGDKILISEGCTHHRQCQDIGTVKLPGWIRSFTKAEPKFCFSSGTEFPEDLSQYKLVVHCGGCMLNEREMQSRSERAAAQNVPMTNYGIAIAYMHGILKRSVAPLPDIAKLLE